MLPSGVEVRLCAGRSTSRRPQLKRDPLGRRTEEDDPLSPRRPELPPRSRGELRAAVYHVTYENEAMRRAIRQFRRTHGRLDLEASLLHVRNLVDFFWAPTRNRLAHDDGVYATHFVPDIKASGWSCPALRAGADLRCRSAERTFVRARACLPPPDAQNR